LFDTGEGLGTVRVNLHDQQGNLLASEQTDSNGQLGQFDGLIAFAPGDPLTYEVSVDPSSLPVCASGWTVLNNFSDLNRC